MRDVLKYVWKVLFYILALAVFLWTASLTVSLVGRLLPGDGLTRYFALALFDGGTVTWLLVFLSGAQGLPQRAISILAFALDLLGVIMVVMAELFLGGQNMAVVPENLGMLVVWGIGIYTAINLVAIYTYHIADPKEMQEIRMRSLQDKVTAAAMDQVESQVNQQAQVLAQQIAAGLHTDVLARLGLLTASTGTVIEGEARDIPEAIRTYASESASTGTAAVEETASTGTNPTPARTKRQ